MVTQIVETLLCGSMTLPSGLMAWLPAAVTVQPTNTQVSLSQAQAQHHGNRWRRIGMVCVFSKCSHIWHCAGHYRNIQRDTGHGCCPQGACKLIEEQYAHTHTLHLISLHPLWSKQNSFNPHSLMRWVLLLCPLDSHGKWRREGVGVINRRDGVLTQAVLLWFSSH